MLRPKFQKNKTCPYIETSVDGHNQTNGIATKIMAGTMVLVFVTGAALWMSRLTIGADDRERRILILEAEKERIAGLALERGERLRNIDRRLETLENKIKQ